MPALSRKQYRSSHNNIVAIATCLSCFFHKILKKIFIHNGYECLFVPIVIFAEMSVASSFLFRMKDQ